MLLSIIDLTDTAETFLNKTKISRAECLYHVGVHKERLLAHLTMQGS